MLLTVTALNPPSPSLSFHVHTHTHTHTSYYLCMHFMHMQWWTVWMNVSTYNMSPSVFVTFSHEVSGHLQPLDWLRGPAVQVDYRHVHACKTWQKGRFYSTGTGTQVRVPATYICICMGSSHTYAVMPVALSRERRYRWASKPNSKK